MTKPEYESGGWQRLPSLVFMTRNDEQRAFRRQPLRVWPAATRDAIDSAPRSESKEWLVVSAFLHAAGFPAAADNLGQIIALRYPAPLVEEWVRYHGKEAARRTARRALGHPMTVPGRAL